MDLRQWAVLWPVLAQHLPPSKTEQTQTCLTHVISFSLADAYISESTITKTSINKWCEQNNILICN